MLELALLASLQQQASPNPDNSYLFFVASEGFDQVALVRFGPTGARIEHRTPINLPSIETTGPLAVVVAPGGQDYYVTTAHGFPTGELLKLRIGADSAFGGQPTDTLQAREPISAVPAALQVSPDGEYAWVTNSTPEEAREPSSISVVYLQQMVEVARIATCAGPRGGRLTADGTRHYSVCMLDDQLVEIDVNAMKIARRLALSTAGQQRCAPSAVTVAADGVRLFVACQRSNDVIEVDARTWSVTRRLAVGTGPGDLAATRDGRVLVVTNHGSQNVSLVDLPSGRELARLATLRAFPAGVVISPDDRYAFVSVAGSGTDPGTVEIIDLVAGTTVATVEVGRGAGGIAFWKMVARKAAK